MNDFSIKIKVNKTMRKDHSLGLHKTTDDANCCRDTSMFTVKTERWSNIEILRRWHSRDVDLMLIQYLANVKNSKPCVCLAYSFNSHCEVGWVVNQI